MVFGILLKVLMLKNCMPLWRNTNLDMKIFKFSHDRNIFSCSDIEKMHVIVAKHKFPNEYIENINYS